MFCKCKSSYLSVQKLCPRRLRRQRLWRGLGFILSQTHNYYRYIYKLQQTQSSVRLRIYKVNGREKRHARTMRESGMIESGRAGGFIQGAGSARANACLRRSSKCYVICMASLRSRYLLFCEAGARLARVDGSVRSETRCYQRILRIEALTHRLRRYREIAPVMSSTK